MKILLIDDQMTILTSLKEALEPGGYECFLFDQPVKAMDCFAETHFDVVVTDLKMPKMDGIDVLKRVQQLKPGTPVIILTGYADTQNAIHAVNYGAYAFYQKPIQIKKFIQTLDAIARSQSVTARPEAEMSRLNEDRSALVAEVNHRVKNNLQIVASLLRIQSRTSDNEATTNALMQANNRITSMALIHEHCYQKEHPGCIRMHDYIPVLCNNLARSHEALTRVSFDYDLNSVCVDLEQAIPMGMVLNELVSNALQHAFTGRKIKHPTIGVQIRRMADNRVYLSVSDNGVGLQPDIDVHTAQSVGFSIVRILVADQLGGEITVNGQKGCTFEALIPNIEKIQLAS